MGDVAMSLINSVSLLDALSKTKVINEAETSPHWRDHYFYYASSNTRPSSYASHKLTLELRWLTSSSWVRSKTTT
jgi:hypothetical protein